MEAHHDQNLAPAVPPDDERRDLVIARPDDDRALPHLAVVGDTYTVLLSGEDTAGRYALIDMLVPPSAGPPPHRHDFEEMFHVLEGEVEATFRGTTVVVREGETVNVPANAPHAFRNVSDRPARLLCMVAPAGLERFFGEIGDRCRAGPRPRRTSTTPSGRLAGGRPCRWPRTTAWRSCPRSRTRRRRDGGSMPGPVQHETAA